MYFDITPKTSKEDLFGREYSIESLVSDIGDKTVRLIVIKGLRRTGKTSLLNVALKETKYRKLKIDVRESPYYDKKEFMLYIIEKIEKEIGESLLKKILKNISQIKLSYKDINTTFYLELEKNFLNFFEKLNERLKRKNEFLVIAFDEVQLLDEIKFENVMAAIFDNYPNIKLILTGSEIGLVDEFIGKKDANSPLFGRALLEIEVKKLNDEQISQFLIKGFQQIKKDISLKEIKEIIEIFDGIIGWATYYGWLRSKNASHQEAILKVIEEGSKLTKKELESFLARRRKINYLKLLRWISKGHNSWALLKNKFLKERKRISDHQLNLYLKELQDYSFIEKINKDYLITDPLLIKALES